MALTRSLAATIVVSCTAFDVAKDTVNTVPEHFQPTIPNDVSVNLKDDCPGCKSEERVPDSEFWELFNSSGKVLKKQAEHAAQAMGLNAHFKEFVPVRYAEQWVSGQRLFIKVRVEPQTFMDIVVVLGLPSSNKKLTLQGIKVGVSEEAPIDDCEESPIPIHPPHDKGSRSEERVPDSQIWELFNSSGKVLQKKAEHQAQAMGLNAHWEEFVPVRYAEQMISGQRLFIKVRVEPQTFIDMVVLLGLPSSNKKPTLEGIKVGVSEEDPIDDCKESPIPIHPPHDKGGRSEEREPDSQIWELFNSSGKALQKKAEHRAQAMGLNAHWEEFVPVRYAEQMVSGQRLFIKVRIEPQTFIDMVVVLGLPSSNKKPTLEGIKVGVSEEAPIDDFEESTMSNIVELAQSVDDLSTLVTAVVAADLADTLSSPGPFTVFAPTNEGFAALPAGTVDTLLKPENKAQLADVLTYHVLPAQVLSKDLTYFQEVPTVEGKNLVITADSKVLVGPTVKDLKKVTSADNTASNGVVHIIDGVMLPPSDMVVV